MGLNVQFIREKLIPALRSGDYKQARNRLARSGNDGEVRYCCLGVVCAVSELPTAISEIDGGLVFEYAFNDYAAYLPPSLANYLGLSTVGYFRNLYEIARDYQQRHRELRFPEPTEVSVISTLSLAWLNDEGWSFEDIANVLEMACDRQEGNTNA